MLTDDRTRDLLRSAVADLTVSEAPADELVRRGRKVRRRTRVLAGVGVAAAVGLVAVGTVVLVDTTDRADQPATTATSATTAPTETPPPSTENGLVTPAGTRLVGMGPIAAAVPKTWGTNDVRCGTPLADTVVFEGNGTRSCLVPQRDVSSVHFGRIKAWEPRSWEQNATTTIDLGGVEITRSEIGRYHDGPGEPTYPFSVGVVTVPDYDVAMWVVSTDEELIRSVLDSVRDIPNGYVAVPVNSAASTRIWPYEAGAGLDIRTVTVYRAGVRAGVLLSSDPPDGSIVREGSRVTRTVAGPGKPLSGPDAPLARKLHAFAAAPGAETLGAIPFSDQVAIGLGGEVVRTLTPSQLLEPSSWIIRRPLFAGRTGPFNALDQLRRDPELWSITEVKHPGEWPHSASLRGYQQNRRLTIEPTDITSIVEWWAVDVYLDDSGSIAAISLDLVEP